VDTTELRGQITRRALHVVAASFLVLFALTLDGCLFFTGDTGPIEIGVSGPEFYLGWDAASISQMSDTPSTVQSYVVYYRSFGTHDWFRLGTTQGPVSFFTIRSSDLAYGTYEFAVQSVLNDGRTSKLHLSSDFNACPAGGWYITWVP
jgi:hypothetical protein